MPAKPHKPTKKLYRLAAESGERGGGWCAFAKRTGLDERTADRHYRATWLEAKDQRVMDFAQDYIDLIKLGVQGAKDVTEQMQVAKSIDSFLSKRSTEWAAKQQIDQTNINIDTSTTDHSKISQEDREIMRKIILKAKK